MAELRFSLLLKKKKKSKYIKLKSSIFNFNSFDYIYASIYTIHYTLYNYDYIHTMVLHAHINKYNIMRYTSAHTLNILY